MAEATPVRQTAPPAVRLSIPRAPVYNQHTPSVAEEQNGGFAVVSRASRPAARRGRLCRRLYSLHLHGRSRSHWNSPDSRQSTTVLSGMSVAFGDRPRGYIPDG